VSRLTKLRLRNFTAFAALDLEFSSGINIFLGTNGTGKTHILKVLYASCAITVGEDREKRFGVKLRNVFSPYEGRIGRIARRQNKSTTAVVNVEKQGGHKLRAQFSNHTNEVEDVKSWGRPSWLRSKMVSAYIPVKEMLAHAPGFLALAAKREIAFEEVYSDLIKQAFLPMLKGPIDQPRRRLLGILQQAIDGRVESRGEHFFLRNKQGLLEFSLLAEGMRKLALVWLLIQNGTLLSGSALFWDEPEANLNPSLMGQVVEVILELQRLGVQVFLSTHNYVLLKEFDLRRKDTDKVRYFSLYRQSGAPVSAKATDSYDKIDPNVLNETFSDLYDRELSRSIGIAEK
jgi:predicted ATP-dependent endonuclease of OLD family